jgi:predicted GNAT family acetyltransferase
MAPVTDPTRHDAPTSVGPDDVVRNDETGQFELRVDGHLARLVFRLVGRRLVLVHTEVPDEIGGRGLGGVLVQAALDAAKANGYTVVPRCPFAAAWLRRHPEAAAAVTIAWPRGSDDAADGASGSA